MESETGGWLEGILGAEIERPKQCLDVVKIDKRDVEENREPIASQKRGVFRRRILHPDSPDE